MQWCNEPFSWYMTIAIIVININMNPHKLEPANIGLAKAGHKMVSYFRIVPELNLSSG